MKTKYKTVALILALIVASLWVLPEQNLSQNVNVINPSVEFQKNMTYILVNGISPYDPWDRVISIRFIGIEIARFITPLHRDGSLPNKFSVLITVPFRIDTSAQQLITYDVLRVQNLWTVNTVLLYSSNNLTEQITPVLYTNVLNITSGDVIFINVPRTGTLYLFISLHKNLEGQNASFIFNGKEYNVFNWHPINELQLTNTGVLIPPIKIENVTSGQYGLTWKGPSGSFLYISAYEVYNSNQ